MILHVKYSSSIIIFSILSFSQDRKPVRRNTIWTISLICPPNFALVYYLTFSCVKYPPRPTSIFINKIYSYFSAVYIRLLRVFELGNSIVLCLYSIDAARSLKFRTFPQIYSGLKERSEKPWHLQICFGSICLEQRLHDPWIWMIWNIQTHTNHLTQQAFTFSKSTMEAL